MGLVVLMLPAVPRSGLMRRLIGLRKVGPMIGALVNAVLLYQSRGRVLVFCVIISIVGHFGMLSGFYFCSRAVKAGAAAPGYWGHLLLIPGAEVGAVFVPVPAGIGAFEGLVARSYEVANEAAGMPVPAVASAGSGRCDRDCVSGRQHAHRRGRSRLLLRLAPRNRPRTQRADEKVRRRYGSAGRFHLGSGVAATSGDCGRCDWLGMSGFRFESQGLPRLLAADDMRPRTDVVAQRHDCPRQQ